MIRGSLQEMVVKLAEMHLRCASHQEMQWKDAVSHFVLRLAYCRTADLRRWFLQHECELFRSRFRNELPASQVHIVPATHISDGEACQDSHQTLVLTMLQEHPGSHSEQSLSLQPIVEDCVNCSGLAKCQLHTFHHVQCAAGRLHATAQI